MKSFEIVLLLLLIVFSILLTIYAKTENDDKRIYEAGQPKVIQGILKGDFALFREGKKRKTSSLEFSGYSLLF